MDIEDVVQAAEDDGPSPISVGVPTAPVRLGAQVDPLEAWTKGFGPMPKRERLGRLPREGSDKAPKVFVPPNEKLPTGFGNTVVEQDFAQAQARAKAQEAADTSFLDSSRAAFNSTFVPTLLRKIFHEDRGAPVPGFVVDPKTYDGLTRAEATEVDDAESPQHLRNILAEQAVRREDGEILARRGEVRGFLAGFLAAGPESVVVGIPPAVLALRRIHAATAAGRRVSRTEIAASNVSENIAGAMLTTGVQATFDPYTGVGDLAMDVLLGSAISVATMPLMGRAVDRQNQVADAHRLASLVAERAEGIEAKAKSNLGDGASREEIQAEVHRLDAEEVKQHVASATRVDEGRRLLPDTEEPEAPTPTRSEAAPEGEVGAAPEATDARVNFDASTGKGSRFGLTPGEEAVQLSNTRRVIMEDHVQEDGLTFTEPVTLALGEDANGQPIKAHVLGFTDDTRTKLFVVKDGSDSVREWSVADLDMDYVEIPPGPHNLGAAQRAQSLRFAMAGDSIPAVGRESNWNDMSPQEFDAITKGDLNFYARDAAGMTEGEFVTAVAAAKSRAPGSNPVIESRKATSPMTAQQRKLVQWLSDKFLPPGYKLIMADLPGGQSTGGDALRVGSDASQIRVAWTNPNWAYVLVHEVGHVVLTTWANNPKLPPKVRDGFKALHAEYMKRHASIGDGTGTQKAAAARTAISRGGVASMYGKALNEGLMSDQPMTPSTFRASFMDFMMTGVSMLGRRVEALETNQQTFGAAYIPNFSEFGAEQFFRYIEAASNQELKWKPTSIPTAILDYIRDMYTKLAELFTFAKENNLLAPDVRAIEFYDSIRTRTQAEQTKARLEGAGKDPYHVNPTPKVEKGSAAGGGIHRIKSEDMPTPVGTEARAPVAPTKPAGPRALPKGVTAKAMAKLSGTALQTFQVQDPLSLRYGIDMMPTDTPQAEAEYKAVRALYERADEWAEKNPRDLSNQSMLLDTALFKNGASVTGVMLRSANPVVRMVASELLESSNGAGGRRSTAAIAKYIHERRLQGNVINEFNSSYAMWRKRLGRSAVGDYTDGKAMAEFNKLVAIEIESRRTKQQGTKADPEVAKAADQLEAVYERARVSQMDAKTTGWAALPETSRGYMPHKMSGEQVRNMTNAHIRAVQAALVDQFVAIEGFDVSFSANLAAKYLDRMRVRALGGADVPMNVHHNGAADVVEDALKNMGLTKTQIRAAMEKFTRGGAKHTKQRLKLDLLAEHQGDDGAPFRLIDIFETDQLSLVRNQMGRVAGELSLAKFGVMGKPGLALLRRAMEFGEDGGKSQPREMEAFDQASAEFLHEPFGTAGSSRWMNRAMQATSLARLGGMAFTQISETINMAASIGVGRTLSALTSMKRLRDEALALSRGQVVDNPVLSSIEKFSGAEFGTDNRKMVFPMDNKGLEYQTFGPDSLGMADRLLRGATHLQAKLSFWRAIHGAQQRGAAEGIVRKSMEYIRDGKEDIALNDMGIDADMRDRLRKELPAIAVFGSDGRLESFDITKISDPELGNAFVQTVHRGTSQMIQDTFIGEKSKWAHQDVARMLTQFRTFSLTSIEKQWGRNVNNRGLAAAFGILMGSMSVAAPIYIARQYVNSLGKPEDEREEYLQRALSPYEIGRATLNYVAAAGLSGDFLDALVSVTGAAEPLGARAGGGSKSVVGNLVAPSLGLVDDAYKAIQNTKDGTDVSEAMSTLPFSRVPYIVPIMNLLGQ